MPYSSTNIVYPRLAQEFVTRLYYEPKGIVGVIVPWNYPLLMATWKVPTRNAASSSARVASVLQSALTRVSSLAFSLSYWYKSACFSGAPVPILTPATPATPGNSTNTDAILTPATPATPGGGSVGRRLHHSPQAERAHPLHRARPRCILPPILLLDTRA